MATTLTTKGQVTIPKRIRDEMHLMPGSKVEFAVNEAGDVVLRRTPPAGRKRSPAVDRFEAARGRADICWRTDDLMKLLRADD
jgi:antitoxin PrlF